MSPVSTRRYARNHVWIEHEGPLSIVGLSARAVDGLGELTSFSFQVQPGDELAPGQCFGVIESSKAEVELFTPIGGSVARVNEALALHPELIADDCYGEGWMLALNPGDPSELATLLDAEAYSELLKTSAHHD